MEKIVFTNGCFDIIHPGHIELLKTARSKGSKLIVGINSDRSVKTIKGAQRPVFSEKDRKYFLENLKSVDEVYIFDELTPEKLIKQLKPDVIVKGGDWKESEIIGAEFVRTNGGEVYSIPLRDGYSTTEIINRINNPENVINEPAELTIDKVIESYLKNHIEVFDKILAEQKLIIKECADLIIRTLKNKNKILICGNGGSAADAQHLAAEFVGRYETERRALPAIALTTDTSALTAISNDYSFKKVFSRQVEALAVERDLLIAISTSGNSENVLEAVMQARSKNCAVIGLTGQAGKKLASLCDSCIVVASSKTATIQEAHITIAHIWCELVDRNFAGLESGKLSG